MAKPISPLVFPHDKTNPTRVLRCDVVFGSPSMNCNGAGICKITGTHSLTAFTAKKSCQHTFGHIAALPGGRVSLFFFRTFLCINLYRKHFRKGVLEMKEACPLPSGLSKGLNIQATQLLPGRYEILEREGYFRVDLDCA